MKERKKKETIVGRSLILMSFVESPIDFNVQMKGERVSE